MLRTYNGLRRGAVGASSADALARPLALAMKRGRDWYAICLAAWRLGMPVVALSDDMPDKVAYTYLREFDIVTKVRRTPGQTNSMFV